MESETEQLANAWIAAKEAELQAKDTRREIEEKLVSLVGVEDLEGSKSFQRFNFNFKVVARPTEKVDIIALKEIALKNGTTEYLTKLFRWTAEINKGAWAATDIAITEPFEAAITKTLTRPTFTIKHKEI